MDILKRILQIEHDWRVITGLPKPIRAIVVSPATYKEIRDCFADDLRVNLDFSGFYTYNYVFGIEVIVCPFVPNNEIMKVFSLSFDEYIYSLEDKIKHLTQLLEES